MNTLQDPNDRLVEGLARVVAVDGTEVWLAAEQQAACGSCATRSACGSSSTKPAASWHTPRTLGPGQTPLALGDVVRIGVDRDALTRASLTAYALPLGTMLLATAALQDAGDAAAIAAALLGLLAGVLLARLLARRWRNALVPLVLGRAVAKAGSSCGPPGTAPGAPRPIAIAVVHQRSQ
ncbi:MAG: SoxR reducing system RseC family protein [Rhodoferax sp.]